MKLQVVYIGHESSFHYEALNDEKNINAFDSYGLYHSSPSNASNSLWDGEILGG
jgi:hypothetical protein